MDTGKNNSNFLKVKCDDCGNEQVIFSKASMNVKCLVCEKMISKSTGGKSKILAQQVEVVD